MENVARGTRNARNGWNVTVESERDPHELRIESHKPGAAPGDVYVRIVHEPSGVWVDGSGPSRRRLEEALLERIEAILETAP